MIEFNEILGNEREAISIDPACKNKCTARSNDTVAKATTHSHQGDDQGSGSVSRSSSRPHSPHASPGGSPKRQLMQWQKPNGGKTAQTPFELVI